MDRNIRIAKELVKLAKSLVAVKSPLDDDYDYVDELERQDSLKYEEYDMGPADTEQVKENKIKAVTELGKAIAQKVKGIVFENNGNAEYNDDTRAAELYGTYTKEFKKTSKYIREANVAISITSSFDEPIDLDKFNVTLDYDFDQFEISKEEVIKTIVEYIRDANQEAMARLQDDIMNP